MGITVGDLLVNVIDNPYGYMFTQLLISMCNISSLTMQNRYLYWNYVKSQTIDFIFSKI